MKVKLLEQDPFTSSAMNYHLEVTLEPETKMEAFELGLLAVRLRNREIWCVFNTNGENPSLTVQVIK